MAASSAEAFKILAKECCRPLSYDSERRRFYFALCPQSVLKKVWNNNREKLRECYPGFTSDDYNGFLLALTNADSVDGSSHSVPVADIADCELVNGELIELSQGGSQSSVLLIRMKSGQYLDVYGGRPLSFGTNCRFKAGADVVTSEGERICSCKYVNLRVPGKVHIVLSRFFLGDYYTGGIASSLWPLHEEVSRRLVLGSSGMPDASGLSEIAASLGINTFTMLCILNSVSKHLPNGK